MKKILYLAFMLTLIVSAKGTDAGKGAAIFIGMPFLTSPVRQSISGAPSEYGNAPIEQLWLNAVQGGSSGSTYRYFMLRLPSSAEKNRLDVVFFNDDGTGFYIPVEMTSKSNERIELRIRNEFGGGEVPRWKSSVLFSIVPSGNIAGDIDIDIDCENRVTSLFVFTRRQDWHSKMSFTRATISNPLFESARKITQTIKK